MILTQSQVSVLLSSFIIFLFTLALFLSGYVLQQKSVSNLRAAIRPQQPPSHTYMPVSSRETPLPIPNLGHDDVLGEQAGVIEVGADQAAGVDGSDAERSGNPPPGPSPHSSDQDILAAYYAADASRQLEHEKLSSVLSLPAAKQPARAGARGVRYTINKILHRWIARVRGVEFFEDEDEGVPLESLGRAARRRRIKMDIRRLGTGEDVDFSKVYRPRKRIL